MPPKLYPHQYTHIPLRTRTSHLHHPASTQISQHATLSPHQVCLRHSGINSDRYGRESLCLPYPTLSHIPRSSNSLLVQRQGPRLLLEQYGRLCQPAWAVWSDAMLQGQLPGRFLWTVWCQLRTYLCWDWMFRYTWCWQVYRMARIVALLALDREELAHE